MSLAVMKRRGKDKGRGTLTEELDRVLLRRKGKEEKVRARERYLYLEISKKIVELRFHSLAFE